MIDGRSRHRVVRLGSITENGHAGAGAPNADTIFIETLQVVKISHRKN